MPEVVFIERDGTERRVHAAAGTSLMRIALDHGIEGIEGICGGVCACATCHCYVSAPWIDLLPPPDESEDFMLDETSAERRPNSRLGCQIELNDALSGIEATIPPEQ